MLPKLINIREKFSKFTEQWTPKIIAECNGQQVKLAKLEGEFVWHDHAEEDELFFVVRGALTLKFDEGQITLRQGEMCVVPKATQHLPVAEEETWVMLFEPAKIKHTGDVQDERTVEECEWV